MSGGELRAEPWSGAAGLRAQEPAWRALLAVSEVDALCNAPEWVLPYVDAYADAQSLFGWTWSAPDGSPAALCALRPEPSRGVFALRRAMLAQDGSFDSDYLAPLVRAGLEEQALDALLDACAERGGVDALLFSCVPDGAPVLAALRRVLERRRLPRRELAYPCVAAPLPDSFDAYLAGLKKRMRSKVRQALRGADEGGLAFAWCDDAAALDEHLDGLFRLHAARWEEAGEDGSFADPRRRAFYASLARGALERGALRFARLDDDARRPVAYQLGLVAGPTYYQLQEGFDVALGDQRVGTALRARAIDALIGGGVTSYDFMAGASQHKSDWGGVERHCTTVAFALPGVRGRVALGARTLLERLRG